MEGEGPRVKVVQERQETVVQQWITRSVVHSLDLVTDRRTDLRPRPADRYRRASLQLRRGRERESWSSKAKLRQRRASDRHNGGGVGAVELWNKLDRLIEERDGNGRKT